MNKHDTQKYNSHKQPTNVNNMILVTMLYTIREWIESGKRVDTHLILEDIDIVINHLKSTKA